MVIAHASSRQRRKSSSAVRLPVKLVGSFFTCLLLVAWLIFGSQFLAARIGNGGLELLDWRPSPYVAAPLAIAYVVSITGCGSDSIVDAAAVLKHSIHLSSVNATGHYTYKMYAIVHPEAMFCGAALADVGYALLERPTLVAVNDIRGDYLRENIEKNGCCGEKELIKLEAYTLIQHPIVVHLDLDTLLMKPLDSIFDLMLGKGLADNVGIMWKDQPLPTHIDAFVTRDYSMVVPGTNKTPFQGGFVILRPSMDVYREFVEIVKEGNFVEGQGWGGLVGWFYGGLTFQGILPYYYDYLHPGHVVELNRCIYNNMCENPRDKPTVNEHVDGKCIDGRDECEDCRSQPVEDIVTTHYTFCQKPWLCQRHETDAIQYRLCRKLHHEWFKIRSSLEESWGRGPYGPGDYDKEQFFGFCKEADNKGYVPIDFPKGISESIK